AGANARERAERHLADEHRHERPERRALRAREHLQQAHAEKDGHRIVQRRLELEERADAALQAHASRSKDREDGGDVGRCNRGAEQEAVQPVEAEHADRKRADEDACQHDSRRRQHEGARPDRAHVGNRGSETAGVENENQRENPERLRNRVVAEREASRPLLADNDADEEKDRQGRDAEAAGTLAEDDAHDQQRGDRDQRDGQRRHCVAWSAPRLYVSRQRTPAIVRGSWRFASRSDTIARFVMSPLSLFGLCAVTLMMVCYALEDRSRWFILGFAIACVLGSIYGFLQGAWPFGLVEAVWAVVAARRWRRARRRTNIEAARLAQRYSA